MKIEKEMYSPESTSTLASGGKAKYSANIVLQDLEEDNEKTLSSNFDETTSGYDSDKSDSESDKSPTPTQQTASPKESEGSFIGSEVEVRSLIYTVITMIQNIIISIKI